MVNPPRTLLLDFIAVVEKIFHYTRDRRFLGYRDGIEFRIFILLRWSWVEVQFFNTASARTVIEARDKLFYTVFFLMFCLAGKGNRKKKHAPRNKEANVIDISKSVLHISSILCMYKNERELMMWVNKLVFVFEFYLEG